MMEQVGIHGFVSGKVQGVFFRDSLRKKAQQLKLRGWVKNLPDGRVEFQAFGAAEVLEQLQNWLANDGPPLAKIASLDIAMIPYATHDNFSIMR
jgi:acylphosphatase